jgi:RNA polymerase sigma-70 factor (ECF subfamily)
MSQTPTDITLLLHAAASGQSESINALMAAIYDDMRRLAAHHMSWERKNHTLQPTAIVHEAYVRLIDQHNRNWKDRLHFFALASQMIRRILIDYARAAEAAKRGGDRTRISLDGHDVAGPERDIDLIALDEALNELARINEQQSKIVELRYFGGCTIEEVAELLQVGKRTVDRDWQAAKAWLLLRLEGDDSDSARGADTESP